MRLILSRLSNADPLLSKPRPHRLFVFASCLLFWNACLASLRAADATPSIRLPEPDSWPSLSLLVAEATTVVVARVAAVGEVNYTRVPCSAYSTSPARLLRVHLEPLVVAKGTIESREIEVITYAWLHEDIAGSQPMVAHNPALDVYEAGSVDIYFLQKDGTIFRPLTDLVSHRHRLGVNATWDLPLEAFESTEELIASVLLLPAKVDTRSGSKAVSYSVGGMRPAIQLVGHNRARDIIQQSMADLETFLPAVRCTVCLFASINGLYGLTACHDNLDGANIPRPAMSLRESATKNAMTEGRDEYGNRQGDRNISPDCAGAMVGAVREAKLREATHSIDAFSQWLDSEIRILGLLSSESRLHFIEMLSNHPNQDVRSLARGALLEVRR